MNKKPLIPIIASILLVPVAFAQNFTPLTNAIKTFADLIFLKLPQSMTEPLFLRVLLWILLFTLYYALLMNLPFKKSPFAKKNVALPIAMIFSLMTAIFMPQTFINLIAHEYGFVSAFILLAVPVVSIIYLGMAIFPTTEAKEPDVGKRRINHAAKGLMYYFVSTLMTSYSNEIAGAITKPAGFTEVYSVTTSICMLLFMYHLVRAIFPGGASKDDGEPSWFEGLMKPKEKETKLGEDGKKGAEENGGVDFGPIESLIGQFNNAVDDLYGNSEAFYFNSTELEEADFASALMELRKKATAVENIDISISALETFKKIKMDPHIRTLAGIRNKYRKANELIIDAVERSKLAP